MRLPYCCSENCHAMLCENCNRVDRSLTVIIKQKKAIIFTLSKIVQSLEVCKIMPCSLSTLESLVEVNHSNLRCYKFPRNEFMHKRKKLKCAI